MITKTKQNWSIGSIVRVSFLSLKIVSIESIRDGLPDIYNLVNLKGDKTYRFIPHNGLERVS